MTNQEYIHQLCEKCHAERFVRCRFYDQKLRCSLLTTVEEALDWKDKQNVEN